MKKISNLTLSSIALLLVLLSFTSCSTTSRAPMKREQLNCAFLGADCSLLKPGADGEAGFRYVAPGVQWNQYNKVIIQPVTYWGDNNSKLSSKDQQALVNFFQQALQKQLSKNFTVVSKPQPGTMVIQVALIDASAATPGLRSISMIIPQLHMLASLKDLATGSYPFVGGAEAELRITDALTGDLIGAAADKQVGGGAMSTGFQWKWGDAENVCTDWAKTLSTRLHSWTSGQATPS